MSERFCRDRFSGPDPNRIVEEGLSFLKRLLQDDCQVHCIFISGGSTRFPGYVGLALDSSPQDRLAFY